MTNMLRGVDNDQKKGMTVFHDTKHLVNSPTMLTASLTRTDDTRWLMRVSLSPKVKVWGELYAPVRAVLAENCSRVIHHEVVEDLEMMKAKSINTAYRVFDVCPAEPHDCVRGSETRGRAPVSVAVQAV